LTLLIGQQEEHAACKKMGGWWRWALVSPDGVAPSRMVGVSVSVNLPLHIKSRSSLLALAHPGGPGKGREMVVTVMDNRPHLFHNLPMLPSPLSFHIDTTLYCLVTAAHGYKQLAYSRYPTTQRPGVELATIE